MATLMQTEPIKATFEKDDKHVKSERPSVQVPPVVYESPSGSPTSMGSATSLPGPHTKAPPLQRLPKIIQATDSKDYKAGRTLILCFDGTGDQFDADNSNIVKLFQCLKKDDRHKQLTYYHPGIGTYNNTKGVNPFANKASEALDMAVAFALGQHVRDGYEFLMQNYVDGDKICLFGFSRGAYTARALAGMLHKVGLLPACNHQQVPFAYQMYSKDDPLGWKMSRDFKKTFSADVDIEFIGVWDTVSSVGFLKTRVLPFHKSNSAVHYFRHALALDEHRAKFKAGQWVSLQEDHPTSPQPKKTSRSLSLPIFEKKEEVDKRQLQQAFDMQEKDINDTDVREVWFAGAHCDVGGGAVSNETRHQLSRIPLRWMIRETFKCNTGILYKAEDLREMGLDVHSLYPMVRPRPDPIMSLPPSLLDKYDKLYHLAITGKTDKVPPELAEYVSEELEDYFDALSPINDMLKISKAWWILEVWPIREWFQEKDTTWKRAIKLNLGRYRTIRERTPKVHTSVRLRQDKLGYKVKPILKHKEVEWHTGA